MARIVDLSAPISGTPGGVGPFLRDDVLYLDHAAGAQEIEEMYGLPARLLRDGEGWAREVLSLGTHNATHVDAPYHYNSTIQGRPAETIDELPLVALLGCFAEGETVVHGAGEMRVKESDRIAGVVDGLRALGADIEDSHDGFLVRGSGGLRGGTIDAKGDHRMAMLGAVAGLASREGVDVIGMDAADVSYPAFMDDLAALCS